MTSLDTPSTAPNTGEVLRTILAVGGVVLFFTALDQYASDAWSAPFPSLWMAAFIGAACLVVAFDPTRLVEAFRAPVAVWLLAFFLVTTLWAVFMKDTQPIWQMAVARYRSIAFLLAFCILFQEPRVRRAALVALAGAVAFGALLNVAEALGVVKFVPNLARVAGRAGGLYVNANTSGLTITVGAAAVVPFLRERWRLPLLLLAAAGVALTFSRSSVLAFGAALVLLVWIRAIRIGALLALAFVAAGLVVYYVDDLSRMFQESGVLNANTLGRLRMSRDDSGRIEVARQAWQLLRQSPLVGSGIGSTADWDFGLQTHNQYLMLGADHGILGLLVLPGLAVALAFRNRRAVAVAVVLLVAGFFSHTLFVERAVLLVVAWLGTAGVAARREAEQEPDEDEEALAETG